MVVQRATRGWWWWFGALGLLWFAAACSGSSAAGDVSAWTVDTALSAEVVAPGVQVLVTCTVADETGAAQDRDTIVTATPSSGIRIEGHEIVADTTGTYAIACALAEAPSVVDDTPAELKVTPGGAVAVDTTVDPTQVAAGEKATVTCSAVGADGEAVDAATVVRVEPADGVDVEDHSVLGKLAGTYAVTCALADVPEVADDSPASLDVVPGPVARVDAHVSDSDVPAGTVVTVTCTAYDAYGNPVEGVGTGVVVQPPEGNTVDDHTVGFAVAGTYEVRCTVDGAPKIESTPATVDVTPGDAAGIELNVDPDKDAYAPGDEVEFSWKVVDAWGNDVGDANVELVPPPQGVTALGGTSYRLDEEGSYTFTAAVPGTALSASRTLVVDQTPPVIVIDYPERGTTFDGDSTIVVEGHVSDAGSGIDVVKVNGNAVQVDADGTFSAPILSEYGLNLVVAKAWDKAGFSADASVAWYWSSAWQSYEGAQAGDVLRGDGLVVWLSQSVLDDGNHDPQHIDDIATLLEVVLSQADLTSLAGTALSPITIPGVVSFNTTVAGQPLDITGDVVITPTIVEVSVSPTPTVSLQAIDGGVHLEGHFPPGAGSSGVSLALQLDVSLPLTATMSVNGPGNCVATAIGTASPSFTTTTSAEVQSLSFSTTFAIAKASGQPLDVQAQNVQVSVAGLQVLPFANSTLDLGSISLSADLCGLQTGDVCQTLFGGPCTLPSMPLDQLLGPISNLVNQIAGPLTQFLQSYIQPLVEPVLKDAAAKVLKGVLEGLALDKTVALPSLPGGSAAQVTVRADLDSVQFTALGGRVGLRAGAWSPKVVDRNPLGSWLRDGCGGATSPLAFDAGNPMGVGVHLDFLNELLFSAWYNGYLHLDAGPDELAALSPKVAALGVKKFALDALLPPLLTDCNGKGLLDVQLGDALVTLDVSIGGLDIAGTFALSLEATASLWATGDQVGVDVQGITQLHIDAIDVNEAWKGKESDLEQLLGTLLEGQLSDLLNGALGGFTLPSIDLSSLVPGVAAGTTLSLGQVQTGLDQGYLVVTGDLQ